MQVNNKQRQQAKKGTITEEIEKLKQRRDDRKHKKDTTEEKKSNQVDNGKCDAEYENLIKKKKHVFNQKPENVKLNNFSTFQAKIPRFLYWFEKDPFLRKKSVWVKLTVLHRLIPKYLFMNARSKSMG
jgi:hypothetical protein